MESRAAVETAVAVAAGAVPEHSASLCLYCSRANKLVASPTLWLESGRPVKKKESDHKEKKGKLPGTRRPVHSTHLTRCLPSPTCFLSVPRPQTGRQKKTADTHRPRTRRQENPRTIPCMPLLLFSPLSAHQLGCPPKQQKKPQTHSARAVQRAQLSGPCRAAEQT